MHELSIATQIVATIEPELHRQRGGHVTTVAVRIGVLSGVDSGALSFCWQAATAGTPLEGARLDIHAVPLLARCRECGSDFQPVELVFRCPECASGRVDLEKGQEIEIDSFTIDEPQTE